MLELDQQDRCLQGVQAAVHAQQIVLIFLAAAMIPQHRKAIGEFRIVSSDQSAVTGSSQVFGGKKTETAEGSYVSYESALEFCANRLGGVFNHRKMVRTRNLGDPSHIGRQPEQVDWHDRPGSAGDGGVQSLGIQVVGLRIDVHEDRLGLQPRDAARSGNKGEWRGDDLVTGINLQRHQREQECIRSGGAGDREITADESCDFRFQLPHLRTHDELLAFQNLFYGSLDLRLHSGVFGLQVKKRKEQLGHARSNEI